MSFVGKWFGYGRSAHYDDGVRAYERGDDEAAIEHFSVCLASEPDQATRERAKNYLAGARCRLSLDFCAAKRYEDARHLLEEAIHIRPSFADLHFRRGLCLARLGDWSQAGTSVASALEINKNYGQALGLKAAVELQAGREAEAGQLLSSARLADPRLPDGPAVEALILTKNGEVPRAVQVILDWLEHPPATLETISRQAELFMKKMRYSDAERLFREAVEMHPRYADLRVKHGQSLLEMGELDAAASEFQEALSVNPKFAEAYALLGVTLRRLGDEDGAKANFRKATEIEPEHPIASLELTRLRI
jgi:Tfp pilus assembly protein PilF